MTLCIPVIVLIHFYYMTLSTGKQRRHMINLYFNLLVSEKAVCVEMM